MELMDAVSKGDLEAVKKLVQDGADINICDSNGYSPLLWSAIMKQPEIFGFLKLKGAKTDIFIESAAGNTESVRQFIRDRVDINAINRHGHRALMLAAHQGHIATVEALIESGADIDATHTVSGNTALIGAAFQGEKAMVELLIRLGADKLKTNLQGKTAYDIAVQAGRTEIAELLKPNKK